MQLTSGPMEGPAPKSNRQLRRERKALERLLKNKMDTSDCVLFFVGNIPPSYHSPDLRAFFAEFTERQAFVCFHFRHRPQKTILRPIRGRGSNGEEGVDVTEEISPLVGGVVEDGKKKGGSSLPQRGDGMSRRGEAIEGLSLQEDVRTPTDTKEGSTASPVDVASSSIGERLCCLVKLKREFSEEFPARYHGLPWPDRTSGVPLPLTCWIARLKNQTGGGVSPVELKRCKEFWPPALMPRGNVGTPTEWFWEKLQACKLPAKIISQLQLTFKKSRGKGRYSHVPFDYGNEGAEGEVDERVEGGIEGGVEGGIEGGVEGGESQTGAGEDVVVGPSRKTFHKRARVEARRERATGQTDAEEREEEEGADEEEAEEEWERHERLHDDVTAQERTKERLYEEEMEVVWEKGGPGLVWYTDAFHWDQLEGGFDERTADDWDIDMAAFEDGRAATMDGQALADMRREKALRQGEMSAEQTSCFHRRKRHRGRRVEVRNREEEAEEGSEKKVGGRGREFLERLGWREGEGLGRSGQGITEPIVEEEVRRPRDTRGFGFHGRALKELRAEVAQHSGQAQQEEDPGVIRIHTVYDPIYQQAPPEHLSPPPQLRIRR